MKFNDLSIQEKAAVIKLGVGGGLRSLLEIRLFWDGMPDDPPGYYEQMEKVANENYRKWGYNNPDEALVHALNDNTYDYRGFYRDNPNAVNNAETHWPDTYKTVYHPTFSNESRYSGIVDRNFNPEGKVGGRWDGDNFIPVKWLNKYATGGPIKEFLRNYIRTKTSRNYNDRARASEIAMLNAWQYKNGPDVIDVNNPTELVYAGRIQNSFLLNGEDKDRYMIEHGYIKGKPGDYGLVSKIVGKKNIPVYQVAEDDISRDNLVPIANPFVSGDRGPYFKWYGDPMHMLTHAGSYPTALYVDGKNIDDFYLKAWDYNDYSNILDIIGYPAVQTTGYAKVLYPTLDTEVGDYFDNYLNLIGLHKENINNKNYLSLPEVIVTPDEYRKGGSIHIKPENRGKFTALKKRTGHSATWFKEHGTPALKKMAIFELNARKWHKHAYGGPDDPPSVVKTDSNGMLLYTLPEVRIIELQLLNENSPYKDYLNNLKLLKRDYIKGIRKYDGPFYSLLARVFNTFDDYYNNENTLNQLNELQYASGFFNKYINSDLYKLRYLDAGIEDNLMEYNIPDLHVVKLNYEGAVNANKLFGKNNKITIPLYNLYIFNDFTNSEDINSPGEDIVHEMAHSIPLFNIKNKNNAKSKDSLYYNMNYDSVPQRWKELLYVKPNNAIIENENGRYSVGNHDREFNESYSDLLALRYFLYKNNIWNSLNPEHDFGEKEYLKLIEFENMGLPVSRFLYLHDKDQTINAINEIAYNELNNNNLLHYAKLGGPIKPFSYLPIQEVRY